MQTKWLECKISEGMFTGEYQVVGKLYNQTAFSLFAEKEDLKFEAEPDGTPVDGKIRVVLLEQKEDRSLVALPQPALENGAYITVPSESVAE
ncbi:MAG: hypothetical protein JW828_03240 [Sedimentisphaerales bacterium]|nr:hypothetical protein [Sedimentisphaerales bacterium]